MKVNHPDYPPLVREVRRKPSISQEDLARELGVSYATVNRWENGQARPSKLSRAQLDAFFERMQAAGALNLPEHGFTPAQTFRKSNDSEEGYLTTQNQSNWKIQKAKDEVETVILGANPIPYENGF